MLGEMCNKFYAQDKNIKGSNADITAMLGSDIEFINLVEEFLNNGNVTCMSELHNTYLNVCGFNGVDSSVYEVKS